MIVLSIQRGTRMLPASLPVQRELLLVLTNLCNMPNNMMDLSLNN